MSLLCPYYSLLLSCSQFQPVPSFTRPVPFFNSPTLLKLSLLFYSLFLFSLQREQVYYFPPFTEDEFLLMFIAFVLQSFFRVAMSLCRFFSWDSWDSWDSLSLFALSVRTFILVPFLLYLVLFTLTLLFFLPFLHADGMCLIYIIRFIGCILFLLFPLYKFL